MAITFKTDDPQDIEDAAYHIGVLPLDRQAPAVMGAPAPQPDQPDGALPSIGGGGGALPAIPNASSADVMSTPPPAAGSSTADQMQLQRDTNSYKPFNQLGVLGKIGRIAGYGASALVPHVAGLIPQTPLGHIAQINQDTANLRGAQQEERAQATERSTQAYQQSEIDKNERPSATSQKPDNPEASAYQTLTDPAATPEEKQAALDALSKIKPATAKSGGTPAEELYRVLTDPNATPQQKEAAKDAFAATQKTGAAEGKAPETREMMVNGKRMLMGWNPQTGSFDIPEGQGVSPEGPQPPHQMVMVPKDGGGFTALDVKPGMDVPKGATTLLEAGKEQTAGDAKAAAQQYADDYIRSKNYTGAGDEALMEKYFELAKPSSGFRMSQPQIEMLMHARDLMGGFQAKIKHLFNPEAPYFSDTQRQQIVDTMKNIQKAGEEARAGGSSQGGPAVGTVEGGYKFKGGDPGKKENWVKQ